MLGIPYEIVLFTVDRQPSDLCEFKASIQLYGMPLYRRTGVIPLSVQPEVQVNRLTVYEEDVGRLQKVHICCKTIDNNMKWPIRRILIRKPVSYQAVSDHANSDTRHVEGKMEPGKKSTKSSTGFDCGAAQLEFDGPCPGLLDHSRMENYWFIVDGECMQSTGNHVAVCEIPATTEDGRLLNKLTESKYEILVKAGNGSNSGKKRSMYLVLCGRDNDSAEVEFRSGKSIQPNGVDKFELTLIGLGELQTVKIRRGEAADSTDWYLEWISIKTSNSRQRLEYLFPCYFFLSRDREDGIISKELTPASSDVFRRWKDGKNIKDCIALPEAGGVATYVIRVRTGTEFGAGTNARVFIELFGEHGCTGALQLSNSRGENGRKKRNMFESGGVATYVIRVRTGTEFGAGTNARVFIELFGEHGCTGALQLSNSRGENGRKKRNMFESGGMDSFTVRTDHVGPVTKIRIGHDSSGASSAWQVDQVEVESSELNRIWTFRCNRWLLPAARGHHVEAEFETQDELTRPLRPTMTFEVKAHTTETSGSPRMTANVFLQLFGRNGEACDPVHLTRKEGEGSPFKPGAVDTFLIETDHIPLPLQKIRLWHDGHGTQPNWNVSRVELKLIHPDDQVNETMVFPCEHWLSADEGDMTLERLLYPLATVAEIQSANEEIQPEITLRQYEIHVITGDEQNAGTDANVYLTLYGENGDSGERKLAESQIHRNKFEAGNTDIFHWDLEYLGKIYKARIRHDGSGPGASWFLSRIEVHLRGAEVVSTTQEAHQSKSEPTVFYCNRWLSTQHDDCSVDRILYAHDYRETEALTSLHTSPNRLSADYPPYLSGTFIFPRSSSDEVRQTDHSVTPTVPYHVRVVTGSIKHAATPGPVWIKCIGKHGEDIGKFLLFNESRGTALRKGTTDKFVFDAPALDALSEIEASVLLTHIGKCYQFNCNTWISRTRGDKKPVKGFSIFRDQIIVGVPLITYQLMIATCDVESAGTDSDVYLQLFGSRGMSNERLVEKKDTFERGSVCRFQMEFEDVGDLQKIRVRQDPQGERRHWKLDRVEINKGDVTYFFETDGGQWLSTKHGTRKLNWTDMVASVNGKKQLDNADLKILVKTSNISGAGTDCGIFIQLFGEHGDSGPWRLTECQNNPTPFKNNALDEFFLRGIPELGSIARCRVWLKQKGRQHSWHCAWIEVTELLPDQYPRLARHWHFECNRWLSPKEEDRQTAWDLSCSEEFVDDPVRGHVNDLEVLQTSLATTDVVLMTERPEVEPGDVVYTVEVHTGMRKNAETSNNAWLAVSGSRGTTKTLEINNSEDIPVLQSGQTNKFDLFSPPVGILEKLNLGLVQHQEQTILSVSAPTDMRNHDSHWFCEWVKVRDPVSRRTYIFQVNKWIEATKRHSTWSKVILDVTEVVEDPSLMALQSLKAKPIVRYKVSVYTGSRLSGGTDANVYITLFAEQPGLSSGRRALKRDGRNLFERNNLDEFQIHCIDLGKITRLRIEHDNTSTRTDWFLDKVQTKMQLLESLKSGKPLLVADVVMDDDDDAMVAKVGALNNSGVRLHSCIYRLLNVYVFY
ncbi:PLAT/LH2 domain protein [Opisthorchis viverrini]|uniref:PLAT/LH2 domain protein n=1 Tax=Opisthorchis viverrini TaxID=6198 RepID=A0A1S8X5H7_OPIVI|nr:PLAT/LH2 domain protein [Opisthorchis viverrini]